MKTRANGVAALLTNWEQIAKAAESAENSEGSALKENEHVIDSLQGRLNILSASVETLSNDAINSELLKNGVSLLTGFVNVLDDIIDRFGILAPLLAGGAAFASLKNVGTP